MTAHFQLGAGINSHFKALYSLFSQAICLIVNIICPQSMQDERSLNLKRSFNLAMNTFSNISPSLIFDYFVKQRIPQAV